MFEMCASEEIKLCYTVFLWKWKSSRIGYKLGHLISNFVDS